MGSKVAHGDGGQNDTNEHVFSPSTLPDAHHSDVHVRHLQPKGERIKYKVNAQSNADANKELCQLRKRRISFVVHETIQLNETDRCYQSCGFSKNHLNAHVRCKAHASWRTKFLRA